MIGDEQPDLLKNEASVQDAIFGVSVYLCARVFTPAHFLQLVCCGTNGARRLLCLTSVLLMLQVLFTISKEKLINSWKYGLAVLLLDVLQVGLTWVSKGKLSLALLSLRTSLSSTLLSHTHENCCTNCPLLYSCLCSTLRMASHGHFQKITGDKCAVHNHQICNQ